MGKDFKDEENHQLEGSLGEKLGHDSELVQLIPAGQGWQAPSLTGHGAMHEENEIRLQPKTKTPRQKPHTFSPLIYRHTHSVQSISDKRRLPNTRTTAAFLQDLLLPLRTKAHTCAPAPLSTESWQRPRSRTPESHRTKTPQQQPLPHLSSPPQALPHRGAVEPVCETH